MGEAPGFAISHLPRPWLSLSFAVGQRTVPVKDPNSYAQCLEAHYATHFGKAEALHLNRGPTHQLPPGFQVLRFGPNSSGLYAFATSGMAKARTDSSIECFLLSPVPDVSQVELLTVIAWYHATTARLGLGHTVTFGRPWMPDSDCDYGLFSLPYLHGPKLENFHLPSLQTRILWLIPITKLERDFKARNGLEALEARFESAGFDYSNPHRPSVIAPNEVAGNV